MEMSSNGWTWVRDRISGEESIAIMCGAGISYQAGLPLAADLITEILRALKVKPAVAQKIESLPFEMIMDVLNLHTDAARLHSIFQRGEPNVNHYFIARLLAERKVLDVLTTNFDTLIEKALQAGSPEGSGVSVLSTPSQLSKVRWAPPRRRLTKIHGCSSNIQTMAITIRLVASREDIEAREAAIRHLFSGGCHRAVWIFGYSCSDAVDISPCIASLSESAKPVYLIEHSPEHVDSIRVEPIGNKEAGNPFKNFIEGYRVYANTDEIIRALWGKLLPDWPYSAPSVQKTGWKADIEAWSRSLTEARRILVRGDLAIKLKMIEESIQEFNVLAESDAVEEMAVGLSNQVPSLLAGGDPRRALEVCSRAVEIYRRLPSCRSSLGNTLGWQGNCLQDLGRFDEALDTYRQARAILSELKDTRGVGNQIGNIANTLNRMGRPSDALEYYQEALEIASKAGNVEGILNQLLGMSVAYLELNSFAEGLACARKGEALAQQIGHHCRTKFEHLIAEASANL